MKTVAQIVTLFLLLAGFLALLFYDRAPRPPEESLLPEEAPAAPADLARHREEFLAGIEALQRQNGAKAVRHFDSFDLEPRDVEQYRLYFLADAYQQAGKAAESRLTLGRLWRGDPTLVYLTDVAFNLSALHAEQGDARAAAEILAGLAARAEQPAVRAAAQSGFIAQKFRLGDPSAMLFAARTSYIDSPHSEHADAAADLTRELLGLNSQASVSLTFSERLQRAENLVRDGNAAAALAELRVLEMSARGSTSSQQVRLARGIAHHRLQQYEESERWLEPLFASQYRFAEPALVHSAKNNRAIAAAIDPFVTKTVMQRQRSGTRRVRVKGKLVRRPVYRNVRKTVKVVDLKKKKKKEEHERRHVERLKDLLQIRTSVTTRKEALATLLGLAQAKKQTPYMQELASELTRLDPASEPGLQYFWDLAWGAYQRGDLATAREHFAYIAGTYANANIERQATYWLARVLDRSGEKQRAAELFQELVNVPYEDLYALHAKQRGFKPQNQDSSDPFESHARSWEEIAEDVMPRELRLAYELTALGANREARVEIQKNANDANRKYADAILSDLYHSEGATILAHRFVRRAYPQIATVEQDSVPAHFLRIYYPLRFEDEIRASAADRKLDPYLVMALIHQESAFNPEIRSSAGAIGLMQIMPATGRELGNRLYAAFAETRLKNPEVNIALGTFYLRRLLDQLGGRTELALAAYNAGPGNVRKWRRASRKKPLDEFIESMPYSETRGYVKRITILRSAYARLYDDLSRAPGRESRVTAAGIRN